jgi:triosephosphate isomerase
MTQRRPLIAANWKMNGSCDLVLQCSETMSQLPATNTEILICPPVIFLSHFPKSERFKLGAQNVSSEAGGAFTGEISADMLANAGCSYVIIGHSERRALYGDTDHLVLAKTKRAVAAKITPIVCFGETLIERQQEKTMQVLAQHLDAVYAAHPELLQHSVIAYEPIWAIGTGETASPAQAQEVHAFIRGLVREHYNHEVADNLTIQYGGSVKADNAAELFSAPDIDGALVGGAALQSRSFVDIVKAMK